MGHRLQFVEVGTRQETATSGGVDGLTDQMWCQMGLDAVEYRPFHTDHRDSLPAGHVLGGKITNVDPIRRRHRPTDLRDLGNRHIDLGRVHVTEIPQLECRLVRDHPAMPSALCPEPTKCSDWANARRMPARYRRHGIQLSQTETALYISVD